jgi:flavin reductase
VKPTAFRAALGRIPTGVMVITTHTGDGHDARTANSFTSVSLEPALVSVCFATSSSFLRALVESGVWGVSVLAADQQHLSTYFAARGARRSLLDIPHVIGARTGVALLTEAVTTLECETFAIHEAGDHVMLIGEVLALCTHRDTASLVFYGGGYQSIGRSDEGA